MTIQNEATFRKAWMKKTKKQILDEFILVEGQLTDGLRVIRNNSKELRVVLRSIKFYSFKGNRKAAIRYVRDALKCKRKYAREMVDAYWPIGCGINDCLKGRKSP